MGWVAEILRKEHRVCDECKLGPTHVYEDVPLCTAHMTERIRRDFSRSTCKGVLFEPALGPDALLFHALTGSDLPADATRIARETLSALAEACDNCPARARFAWVPTDRDENLWSEEWLLALRDGTLRVGAALCGACAADRLSRSLEARGLYFEMISPPKDADGAMLGAMS